MKLTAGHCASQNHCVSWIWNGARCRYLHHRICKWNLTHSVELFNVCIKKNYYLWNVESKSYQIFHCGLCSESLEYLNKNRRIFLSLHKCRPVNSFTFVIFEGPLLWQVALQNSSLYILSKNIYITIYQELTVR